MGIQVSGFGRPVTNSTPESTRARRMGIGFRDQMRHRNNSIPQTGNSRPARIGYAESVAGGTVGRRQGRRRD